MLVPSISGSHLPIKTKEISPVSIKVLAFGTFDILHPGHGYFLKRAKEYGEHLTVVVARDFTVKQTKGMFPQNNENIRVNDVKKVPYVDEVILGSKDDDKLKIIEQVKPDVICLGYDQTHFTHNLMEEMKKRGIEAEIVRIDAYKKDVYKSSKLKQQLYKGISEGAIK